MNPRNPIMRVIVGAIGGTLAVCGVALHQYLLAGLILLATLIVIEEFLIE